MAFVSQLEEFQAIKFNNLQGHRPQMKQVTCVKLLGVTRKCDYAGDW